MNRIMAWLAEWIFGACFVAFLISVGAIVLIIRGMGR